MDEEGGHCIRYRNPKLVRTLKFVLRNETVESFNGDLGFLINLGGSDKTIVKKSSAWPQPAKSAPLCPSLRNEPIAKSY